MNRNYILIVIGCIVTIGLLVKFIPKNKIREASVAFSFKQFLAWILGLIVVQFKLIEYPVRLFSYATKSNFTFEYFVYPSLSAIFNIHYPKKKSAFGQFMYYFYFCTTMTAIEIFVEKNTDLLKYIHWTWYITWSSLFITFYCTRKYYEWFFKLKQNN
ncbi:hypothetical protein LGK95_08300 [Clostridium algoriphilum]|uniref:CBO0543 family protein n=1 Tax=Clostridium algoriphilum TaxID=198347 RepID=UPI001CF45FC2|nr:CBO0543 family protein [Clostridium algoriphilum]MCB2293521.1 hypothetical protein [Clostridium algoriphilum]